MRTKRQEIVESVFFIRWGGVGRLNSLYQHPDSHLPEPTHGPTMFWILGFSCALLSTWLNLNQGYSNNSRDCYGLSFEGLLGGWFGKIRWDKSENSTVLLCTILTSTASLPIRGCRSTEISGNRFIYMRWKGKKRADNPTTARETTTKHTKGLLHVSNDFPIVVSDFRFIGDDIPLLCVPSKNIRYYYYFGQYSVLSSK